jgi:hypothetical protein
VCKYVCQPVVELHETENCQLGFNKVSCLLNFKILSKPSEVYLGETECKKTRNLIKKNVGAVSFCVSENKTKVMLHIP